MNKTSEPVTTDSAPAPEHTPEATGGRLAVQLRGLPFAAQEATLAPRDGGAPVQRVGGGGVAAATEAPQPGRLARIAADVLAQLARAINDHVHIDGSGSPTGPSMPLVIVPRGLSPGASDLATVAAGIREELALMTADVSSHTHASGTGPSGPPIVGPLPRYVTGAEADLAALVAHFRSDLEVMRSWFVQHVHVGANGPTSAPIVPLAINDSDLVVLGIELQSAG